MNARRSQTIALVVSTICLLSVAWCVSFSSNCQIVKSPEATSWKNDFGAFQQYIAEIVAMGNIPSAESLAACEDVFVITDGAGGLIDPSPGADSVQFLLNRVFNQQRIHWEIKIYYDSTITMLNRSVILPPLPSPEIDLMSENGLKSLSVIGIYVHGIPEDQQLEFHAGDTLLVEATIGRGEFTSIFHFSGVLAVQHLSEMNKPLFVVGVHDATITRLSSEVLVER